MPTHSPNDPVNVKTPQPGYEASDVSATGIAVFLASLLAFIVVFFVFCFGMGKVINNQLVKRDGPPNKWNNLQYGSHEVPKNMASNPAMEQQQLQQMTQRFPTPRLETDDGNQDLADLHEREALLLDHYSWIDRGQGKIRIPVERAMELIAQHGLPVVTNAQPGQPTAPTYGETPEGASMEAGGNGIILPPVPLTNGFAPTGYEQELAITRKAPEVAEAGDKHP
ncbi:hypothetical protein ACPOL_1646 [Acidisarcina polymorpha]|uniref:Uncharacterized protein n=1 Tax=Acidisarcina polymorpha TaxID=2211140 RepID=A0A2Z5FW52_9BACT|nr:hypothetical protein [Acidisarcina polymorpha]AXC10992.1 hypothetical protein ACPOL_1646 [Acidisarcina polymorpha]